MILFPRNVLLSHAANVFIISRPTAYSVNHQSRNQEEEILIGKGLATSWLYYLLHSTPIS